MPPKAKPKRGSASAPKRSHKAQTEQARARERRQVGGRIAMPPEYFGLMGVKGYQRGGTAHVYVRPAIHLKGWPGPSS